MVSLAIRITGASNALGLTILAGARMPPRFAYSQEATSTVAASLRPRHYGKPSYVSCHLFAFALSIRRQVMATENLLRKKVAWIIAQLYMGCPALKSKRYYEVRLLLYPSAPHTCPLGRTLAFHASSTLLLDA